MADDYYDKTLSLQRQNHELQNRLEQAVQLKIQVERDLYAKFLAVLNEKKRKIAELQDALALGNVGQNRTQHDSPRAYRQPTDVSRAQGTQGSPTRSEMLATSATDGAVAMAADDSDDDDGSDGHSMMPPPQSSQRLFLTVGSTAAKCRTKTANKRPRSDSGASMQTLEASLQVHPSTQTLRGGGDASDLNLEDRL